MSPTLKSFTSDTLHEAKAPSLADVMLEDLLTVPHGSNSTPANGDYTRNAIDHLQEHEDWITPAPSRVDNYGTPPDRIYSQSREKREVEVTLGSYIEDPWGDSGLNEEPYGMFGLFPDGNSLIQDETDYSAPYAIPNTAHSSQDISKLLREDVIIPAILDHKELPSENELWIASGSGVTPEQLSLEAGPSSTTTPSLVASPTSQSLPTATQVQADTNAIDPAIPHARRKPSSIVRRADKYTFYIDLPGLPDGLTRDDYAPTMPSFAANALKNSHVDPPADKMVVKKRKRKISPDPTPSTTVKKPREESVSGPSTLPNLPLERIPNRTFVVDSSQAYEEYICSPILTEVDPGLLDIQFPVSAAAIALSTTKLRRAMGLPAPVLKTGSRSIKKPKKPPINHDSSTKPEVRPTVSTAPPPQNVEPPLAFASTSSVPYEMALGQSPFDSLDLDILHDTADTGHQGKYVPGIDDVIYGDTYSNLPWTNGYEGMHSYAPNGTVDPSLLGGGNDVRSISPSASRSGTSQSLELNPGSPNAVRRPKPKSKKIPRPPTASTSASTSSQPRAASRMVPALFLRDSSDSDPEAELVKLDKDDSMYRSSIKKPKASSYESKGKSREQQQPVAGPSRLGPSSDFSSTSSEEERPFLQLAIRGRPKGIRGTPIGRSVFERPQVTESVSSLGAPSLPAPSRGTGRGRGRGRGGASRSAGKDAESASAAPASSKRRGKAPAVVPNLMAARMQEKVYCHQCRRATAAEKMTCTNMLEEGLPCRRRYCSLCIVKRYPDLEFNAFATVFECPSCLGNCNCDVCCRKRGEEFIPSRRTRVNADLIARINAGEVPDELLSAPEEFMRLSKQIDRSTPSERSTDTWASSSRARSKQKALDRDSEAPERQSKPSDQKKAAEALKLTTAFIEKSGVVTGAYFGAVFSVTGDRIGAGFIGGNTQQIIIKPATQEAARSSRRKRRRTYIGRLQDSWGFDESGEETDPEPVSRGKGKGKGRPQRQYVGNPSVLFRRKVRSVREPSPLPVMDDLPPTSDHFDPSNWSSADAEGEDDDEDESSHWIMADIIVSSSSPVRPVNNISQEQLSLVVAKALEAVRLDNGQDKLSQ